MSGDTAAVVYPHQLFDDSPVLESCRIVYLVEEPLFFSQFAFHRQKLMLHRASMKSYARDCEKKKKTVRYVEAAELKATGDLAKRLADDGVRSIRLSDPEDDWLMRRVRNACREQGLEMQVVPNSHFLTSVDDIEAFVGSKKKLFFTQFYIEQRKRLDCLLDDDGTPNGGKWSFDSDNRKKMPKGITVPKVTFPSPDRISKEARVYVNKRFPKAPGVDRELIYPTNRPDALRWLGEFLVDRFQLFGDFEDAIVPEETFLFHSCLTPMLNIGLISPRDVLDKALEHADRIPFNSLEGFIRQVIGWREFIRAVYRMRGGRQRTVNFWGHERKIPKSFYDGSTGIVPIDTVIRRVLEFGYCHHIERLMILGNFMLLCEFHPDEVYRWFMELFVDAYDWVMVPNIYGMSQHADGGLMTTKPYISGSSYVLKMSSFKRGPWCEVWDGLYWRFMAKHRPFFEVNPRMSVMTKQLDKMGAKLEAHILRAEDFLNGLRA